MNTWDVIIGILLALAAIRGLIKGFLAQAVALAAWIAALYGAFYAAHRLSAFIARYVTWPENYCYMVAFALIFAGILIAGWLVGRLLTKAAGAIFLGWANRLLGALLGGFTMALLLGAAFLLMEKMTAFYPKTAEKSMLYQPLKNLGRSFFARVVTLPPLHKPHPGSQTGEPSRSPHPKTA